MGALLQFVFSQPGLETCCGGGWVPSALLLTRGKTSDSLSWELNMICVRPCSNTGFFHRSAPPSLGMVRSSMSLQAALLQAAGIFHICLACACAQVSVGDHSPALKWLLPCPSLYRCSNPAGEQDSGFPWGASGGVLVSPKRLGLLPGSGRG